LPLNIGTPEILIILFIALLLLGPSKLPQLARSLGEALREFRRASSSISESISAEETRRPPPQPLIPAQAAKREGIDPETLKKLAEKLGVSREGKTEEELIKEIIAKAKEKGLLEEGETK